MTDLGTFDLTKGCSPKGKSGPVCLAYKLGFYAAFLAFVDARAATERPIVFGGDINTAHRSIDFALPGANAHRLGPLPEERIWLGRWGAHDWVDTFRYRHSVLRDTDAWRSLTGSDILSRICNVFLPAAMRS